MVQYWQPIQDAISRAKSLLFRPFDFRRWFVLGFTAWLVHLGRTSGSAFGNDPELRTTVSGGDVSGMLERVGDNVESIMPAGIAVALVMALVAFAVVVGILLLWVGSRARFIWLENLTARDDQFSAHWSRFADLGNSFFLWKLGFTIAALLVFVPLVIATGVWGAITGDALSGPSTVLGWMTIGTVFFALIVVLAYIDFFAESFVTVIMHRRGLSVMPAWAEFRRLFEAQPGHFVLVGLVKLLLQMAVAAVVAVLGVATCCVGFAVLAIPYLGTVLLLPVYAMMRYFDLVWLGQFDPDLRLPEIQTETPLLAKEVPPSADESTPDSDLTP